MNSWCVLIFIKHLRNFLGNVIESFPWIWERGLVRVKPLAEFTCDFNTAGAALVSISTDEQHN